MPQEIFFSCGVGVPPAPEYKIMPPTESGGIISVADICEKTNFTRALGSDGAVEVPLPLSLPPAQL